MIITGANADYFPYLHLFSKSLRENSGYSSRVIVCDNMVGSAWNRPGKIRRHGTFTSAQRKILDAYRIEVVNYIDLLREHGVPPSTLERTPSRTSRLPHKFAYCALMVNKYADPDEPVLYFDSDAYFQLPLDKLESIVCCNSIFMSHEGKSIQESRFMFEWIQQTDLSFATNQNKFISSLAVQHNYCTGFIGGNGSAMGRFMTLCWMFATNSMASFASDQPLVNVLKGYFGYPIASLSRVYVAHVKTAQSDSLNVVNGVLTCDDVKPCVAHFNGAKHLAQELMAHHSVAFETGGRGARNLRARLSALLRRWRYHK